MIEKEERLNKLNQVSHGLLSRSWAEDRKARHETSKTKSLSNNFIFYIKKQI